MGILAPMEAATVDTTARGPAGGTLRKLYGYYLLTRDPIGVVGERFARYGDVYVVPDDPDSLFVFRHPDHLYEILVDRAQSFTKEHSALARMRQWLGEGLLTSDGATWRRHRRMI